MDNVTFSVSTLLPFCPEYNSTNDTSTWAPNTTGLDCVPRQPASKVPPPFQISLEFVLTLFMYGLICVVGLVGNGLVIFVITRYTKMKTVTNMYILNLSIADLVFLLGMPMIMTTYINKGWLFGFACCKIYYMLTCINMFTGSFTLTVMSGDRFLAVCYPINSMRYRTPKYALIVIALTWIVSFLVMLPVVLYAQTIHKGDDHYSCVIKWPSKANQGSKIFTFYNLVLGFVLPVLLISVLYTLLIIRLRTTGSTIKRVDKRRPHRKVTRLVTMIIAVYIVCWVPYWAFQIHLITLTRGTHVPNWKIDMYKVFSLLSYANSMVNPLLYAFTNDNFRESFISAFRCARDPILGVGRRTSDYVNANSHSMCGEYNGKRSAGGRGGGKLQQEPQTQYEFTVLNSDENKPGVKATEGDITLHNEAMQYDENNGVKL